MNDAERRKRAESISDRIRFEVLAAKLLNEATQGAYDAEDVTQWADKIESLAKAFAAEVEQEAYADCAKVCRDQTQYRLGAKVCADAIERRAEELKK